MAKKKTAQEKSSATPTFEESLAELEAIVDELESGKLGLSDALARYEQGVKHLKSCHALLERAERKIDLLSGVDAEGRPITEPFDDEQAASLEEKAASRSRRRSRKTETATPPADEPEDAVDDDQRLF